MKIAFVSPLPPARSGIADYAAALLKPLRGLAEVETFTEAPPVEVLRNFDQVLYQMGNNEYHVSIYERALEYPGVVVLHEGNLHHLHAHRTIKRRDWDSYVLEVEYDGGEVARVFAERVRRLEIGPDYEGVPMLRRLLENSKAVIVHSDFVAQQVRSVGFTGPIEKIWHGAWVDRDPTRVPQRTHYREKLGLPHSTTLIGVFGFLKPYKRIAESLRAFRRLLRVEPNARMVLVGDPHPELDLDNLLRGLHLEDSVRVLGFISREEDFNGYLEACDIILNLRYPTVGESSGTLLRSLSLGKPVLVTDIGSFREYPDDIVLKVPSPPDPSEEDTIFEYLNLLSSQPKYRDALGNRAKAWVEKECPWDVAAAHYVRFLDQVAQGTTASSAPEIAAQSQEFAEVPPESIQKWAQDEGGKQYIETHITRLTKTLELTPRGGPGKSILEMGAYMQITPALHFELGYESVRGCYYGKAGQTDHHEIQSANGEAFACDIDLFDAEKDPFPYSDESFDTVLCCELLEHLTADPMHMMSEINRILKPGGALILTTPNISSLRAIHAILHGYHPSFFPAYILPRKPGEEAEARHNREYSPKEIYHLYWESGLEVTMVETGEFLDQPHPEQNFVRHLLEHYKLPTDLRGDGIYAVGRKTGPIRNRYPNWLYA